MTTDGKGHLIHYTHKQQRRVVRATFTAELLGACDTQDLGFLLGVILHEMLTGVATAAAARQLRETGGMSVPMVLYIDAMSVFAAITALQIKVPADSSVLCYLQYLRELMEHRVLHALVWVDTRDMLADGMTKGAVERKDIHAVMNGDVKNSHQMKLWKPKVGSNSGVTAVGPRHEIDDPDEQVVD